MSSNIYTSYDEDDPPAHPGEGWTRFVCISDTHSRSVPIPPGDVLLHGGDLSSWGQVRQLKKTVDWLISLPHTVKILIAGNHDFCLDDNLCSNHYDNRVTDWRHCSPLDNETAHELLEGGLAQNAGFVYLDRTEKQIVTNGGKTWKVYGSPASPLFLEGAFQYERGEDARNEWSNIPDDVDILLTHTPPYGVLDLTTKCANVGCEALAYRLPSLKKCRLHVFGHIHESRGAYLDINGRDVDLISVNAAVAHGEQAVIVDLQH